MNANVAHPSHSELPSKAYAIDGQGVDAQAFYALACDPHQAVAVQACAGAGKTWMLVSRMLRALLDGARADEILAITFTKKAAAEMRDRLIQVLAEFSRQPLVACAQELQLRGLSEARAQAQARDFQCLYQRLLTQGENLQVRTFHSWFSSLLDMAPQDLLLALDLPLEYTLVEDDSSLLEALWPVLWRSMASDPDLLGHYRQALDQLGDFKLMAALKDVHQRRQERHFMADSSWEDLLPAWPVDIPKPDGVLDLADFLQRPALRQTWLGFATALGQLGTARAEEAARSIEHAFDQLQGAARLQALRKALLTDKGEPRKALEKWPAREEALAMLGDLMCIQRQEQAAALHTSMLALARALDALYQAHKRRNKLIDMVDLEEVAHRLLTDDVLSGWLQERLDWQFRYLLIDEFQDTSPLQWQALSTWLSSYAGHTSQRAPVVFIVGDPKQSIYRFRRAEPRVFLAAQSFVATALQGHVLSCDHTRRNARSVIDAVNRVFAQVGQAHNRMGFRPHTTQSQEEGAVIILPMVERPEKISKSAAKPRQSALEDPASWIWRDSLNTEPVDPEQKLVERQCQEAAQALLAFCQGLGPAREEGAQGVSCMVLARKRDRLRTMHRVLQTMGIAADMPETEALQSQSAVQDVIALISALILPSDDLSLVRALKSPIFSTSDEDLVTLADWRDANMPGTPFLDVLPKMRLNSPAGCLSQALEQAAVRLTHWRALLSRCSMHELLQRIYADQHLLEQYVQLGDALGAAQVKESLCALLFQSLELEGGRFQTPSTWLAAWSKAALVSPSAPTPTGRSEPMTISLLTIHGAKGLEADVVLILDAAAPTEPRDAGQVLVDWPAESARPRTWVYLASQKQAPGSMVAFLENEQQERVREELNALYVAMTRARRCLMVAASAPRVQDEGSWWSHFLRAGFSPSGAEWVSNHSGLVDINSAKAATALSTRSPAQAWTLGWEPLGWSYRPVIGDGENVEFPALETAADTGSFMCALAARKGEALHWLLERASPRKFPGKFWSDQHIQQLHLRNRAVWQLDESDLSWALDCSHAILTGPARWAWDATRLLWSGNEVSVVHQSQLLRIDRLVHHADHGIWILDYKSSLRPDLQAELLEQLRIYQRAITHLEQDVVHAAFITADGKLIEVT